MKYVVASAYTQEDHARTMLCVVRDAGIDARLIPMSELEAAAIPDWLADPDGRYWGVMLVPEGQKELAEIASHKFYGLCRWCGRRLGGKTSGECPDCGTPIDAPRAKK